MLMFIFVPFTTQCINTIVHYSNSVLESVAFVLGANKLHQITIYRMESINGMLLKR